MNRILFSSIFSLLFFLACKTKKQFTHQNDYSAYLKAGIVDEQTRTINDEIEFWKKRLEKDTSSFVNKLELANNYIRLFKLRGEIADLKCGDSLLRSSSEKLNNTAPGILYSLSQKCITQHQFANAASYNLAAEKAEGDPYTIHLLQFDVDMELGKYQEALSNLNSIKDRSSFDYLIRKAKLEDHRGNLDGAIELMELAFEKVKNKKQSLYCWALSNLGDMYGHAGRIKEAYQAYLDVLKKDPANLYCLKGIAWIAYSHDHNTAEANRILQYILSQTNMPDLKLILAELENEETKKTKWLNEFLQDVERPEYGAMYNKYLIHIYSEDQKHGDKAVELAKKENESRFTPETCDWLAWAYYNKGDAAKAFDLAKGYVYKRNFEPTALMHTAFIFADNGKTKEARSLMNECLASSFELGPVATKKIREKLRTL